MQAFGFWKITNLSKDCAYEPSQIIISRWNLKKGNSLELKIDLSEV